MSTLEDPLHPDPAATYDALGRKQPQRLGFMVMARAIPGFAALFSGRVPDGMYALVEGDVVEVLCVCKPPEPLRCHLWTPTPCACDRWFVYTGADVRVARVSNDDGS